MLAYVNEEWAGRGVGRAMSSYRRLLANFGMGATVLFALVGCFTYTNF